MKKGLLLSPYDVSSHQYWREGVTNNLGNIHWTTLTLPPRHFAWRTRSNSLTWSLNEKGTLNNDYDFLLCTSMTDLSSLRGLSPKLCQIPNLVYCHENQLAFPENADADKNANRKQNIEQKLVNIYTLLCADKVLFNSEYNLNSFINGLSDFLTQFPDHVPKDIEQVILSKSQILPVPLDNLEQHEVDKKEKTFSIVWNHRWEYDKDPELLDHIVTALCESNMDFQFHLIGQMFRQSPNLFKQISERLKEHKALGKLGFIENKKDYYQLLAKSHLVLSSARHEFQGLAVMEAVALGCHPVLPKRLSYPEFFPASALYDGDDMQTQANHCVEMIASHYKNAQGQLALYGCDQQVKTKIPFWNEYKDLYLQLIESSLD